MYWSVHLLVRRQEEQTAMTGEDLDPARLANSRVMLLPGLYRLISFACIAAVFATLGCRNGEKGNDVEADFQTFFEAYVQGITQRNTEYLLSVHPDLPSEMHEFFFDVTQEMMQYAGEHGLEPSVECREYNVCKVTWPQPGGSWAAQSFIRHQGEWRFLPG